MFAFMNKTYLSTFSGDTTGSIFRKSEFHHEDWSTHNRHSSKCKSTSYRKITPQFTLGDFVETRLSNITPSKTTYVLLVVDNASISSNTHYKQKVHIENPILRYITLYTPDLSESVECKILFRNNNDWCITTRYIRPGKDNIVLRKNGNSVQGYTYRNYFNHDSWNSCNASETNGDDLSYNKIKHSSLNELLQCIIIE